MTLLVVLITAAMCGGASAQVKGNRGKKPLSRVVIANPGALRASIVSLGPDRMLSGAPQNSQLDLGRVSYGGGATGSGVAMKRSGDALTLTTRFGLLVEEATGHDFRTATVRAFVIDGNSPRTYAIDGIRLTPVPQTIGPAAPIGFVSAHRLEITIPTGEAPGPVASNIGFLVSPN